MNQPKFVHDCEACVYLGEHEGEDLYYCAKSIQTVIARYGNEGSDYMSGMRFADPTSPNLAEAKRRANERGLTRFTAELGLIVTRPVFRVVDLEVERVYAKDANGNWTERGRQ